MCWMWGQAKYHYDIGLGESKEHKVDVWNVTIQYQQTWFPWTTGHGNGIIYISKPIIPHVTICPTIWRYSPVSIVARFSNIHITIANVYTPFTYQMWREHKSICGYYFQCCNEFLLALLFNLWIFFPCWVTISVCGNLPITNLFSSTLMFALLEYLWACIILQRLWNWVWIVWGLLA